MELSLLTALLAKLFGPTFARILFAYALQGKIDLQFIASGDVAETLADSLDIAGMVDGLSGGDRKATRNAPHLFETIGDAVAEQIAELFAKENIPLSAGEVEQAASAAKAVMNYRGLALLVETRFQRLAFREKLSASPPPAAAGWSEEQRSFYRRLLDSSADYLFAAAEQIPHFTRDTTAQLLQDTGHLLERMQEGLVYQQRILAASYGPQRQGEFGQFEQDYRTALAGSLDRLQLFGVPLVDGARQPLSVAFVKMRLAHAGREEEREDLPGFGKPGRSEARSQILSVSAAFALNRRLVVIAPAGLGKTTLLRWAAVQMARPGPETDNPLWRDRVPFFVQLRDYSRAPLPPIADLPLAYRGDGMELLAGAAPEGWARQQMRAKRAALFLDGLDEINEAKRQEALAWVENLLALEPELVVILSGRPAAVDRESAQPELTRLGFDFVSLQPLDDERIDGFVTQWHRAMAEESCKYPDKSRIPAREARLAAALARRADLRHLAATPLIAAMLCALNLTEERELPRDRIRLYNRCVALLLERDEARQVDTSGYGVTLRAESARRLLGEIAFWMLGREQSTIARRDAVRLISGHGLEGEKIARYLAERTGLLQPQSQEVYDFAHRTFQEFLAAQHIAASHQVVQVVRQYAGQKAWRETIAFLGGFVDPSDQEELLESLWEAAQNTPDEAQSYHLLAWAFWDLVDDTKTKEATALMARHTAKLCSDDGRSLDLTYDEVQVSDVTPLAGLTHLQELHLQEKQVEDITPLAGLTNLQDLSLLSTLIVDIQPLAVLERLRILDLTGTLVRDVTPLAGLTNLQILYLGYTYVEDITPLKGLIATGQLVIELGKEQIARMSDQLHNLPGLGLQVFELEELHLLTALTNLQTLGLSDSEVEDVTPLAGLIKLQSLNLSETQVEDVTPLAGLINLQTLNLSETQVEDVTPLAGLINLQSLNLRNTQIEDVTPLAGLTCLQELSLSDTQVGDVTPLVGLTSLQYLYLSDTEVEDVTPLAGLTSLQELYLRNAQVRDVTPLAGLTSLQSLDLSNTHVGDVTPLAGLTGLQELDLRGTRVTDISPLARLTNLKIVR